MLIAQEGLIWRDSLMDRLDTLLEAGAVYVSAPAGFGKSVAVRQWAESRAEAVAAMALDEYDNSMDGFCQRFCAMLRRCQPQNSALCDLLSQRAPSQSPRSLAMEAVALLSGRRRCLMLFDDLHHLRNESVAGLMGALLLRLPESFRVLLVSRDTLPPALSALEPRELGPQHLRFSHEDIACLYRKQGRPLTGQSLAEIARYTGGWPVGVCALLRLEGEAESGRLARLDEFIQHNIWSGWDERTQAFMLNTAQAGALHPGLCDALAHTTHGATLLQGLADRGAFVTRRGDGTFAYDPIFQGFLRRRLAEQGAERGLRLLRREGEWYLERGDFYRAVACFIRCESPDGIVRCFDMFERFGLDSFEVEGMLPIINAPQVQAAARARPSLRYFMAWAAYAEGRDRDMTQHMDACYAAGLDYGHRGLHLQLLDFRRPLLPAGEAAHAAQGGGQGFFTLGLPLLHRSIRDFSPLALGDVEVAAQQIAAATGRQLMAPCLAAGLLFEQGRYGRALELIEGLGLPQGASPALVLCAGAVWVCVLDALGRRAEADRALEETRTALGRTGAEAALAGLEGLSVRRSLAGGDGEAVRRRLAGCRDTATMGTHMHGIYDAYTAARAHTAAGDCDSAIILLTRLCDLARRFNRPLDVIEAYVLLAIACWKKRQSFQADALRYMECAVRTAQPYGFTALFEQERAELTAMLPMLRERMDGGDAGLAGFVGTLCDKLGCGQSAAPIYGPPGPTVSFTQKQRRVMKLLCAGMSYREIARSLGIKLPTLRSHMALIYKKLDVSNEGDAVRRIKALALTDHMDKPI